MTTIAPTTPAPAPARALMNAHADIAPMTYCDRCRVARAKTRLTVYTGTVLYLCAHHYAQHEMRLETDPSITIHTEPNECQCATCAAERRRGR